jgi:dihydropteroate synthase-like protein
VTPDTQSKSGERILFVTGRLAEYPLRRVLEELQRKIGLDYDVTVLGISVAALMHVDWVLRKLDVPAGFDRVVLPGWCRGSLEPLEAKFGIPFETGPKDLYDLPEYFGQAGRTPPNLDAYDIDILAEINHAPRLSDAAIVEQAAAYRDAGADVIDLGCIPGESWQRAGAVTKLLCGLGHRVSIDSFDRAEVEAAVAAGAELVLSCNGSNVAWAAALPAELVVIPDDARDLKTWDRTLDVLRERGARFRVDPVLEPIGYGFAASLARYFEVRRQWPDVEIMMGVGNLTELTEVDSAGVNFLLAGVCQELGIRSVLTTQVINWARSAVREFDLARRLVYHSLQHRVLPKHLDSRLVMLRDPKLREMGDEAIRRFAAQIKDPNFRILVERGTIYLLNRDGCHQGDNPFELFQQALQATPAIDPAHAFYLGYELSKAVTALTLGKQYTQDEPLKWGFLEISEYSAHEAEGGRRKGGG